MYLLHKPWYKKWKLFVHLKEIKRGKIPSFTPEELDKNNPGRITNEALLKDFNKYLREEDPSD